MFKIKFIAGQIFCTLVLIFMVLANVLIAEYGVLAVVQRCGRELIDAVGKHFAFALMLTLMLLLIMIVGAAFGILYVRISEKVLQEVGEK